MDGMGGWVRWVDGWMDGWMDNGWMGGWMDEWMEEIGVGIGELHEWMGGRTDKPMNR